MNSLNFKYLEHLPKLMKRHKVDVYKVFNQEDVDDIYYHWLQLLRFIQHLGVHMTYLNALGIFFNNGVNKLKITPNQAQTILFANQIIRFLNQKSYDYFIKNNNYLTDILLKIYFDDVQQFMTQEELIEYAYDGYEIDLEQIEDSNLKNKLIFIQNLSKRSVING